jgi:hypothetical protein
MPLRRHVSVGIVVALAGSCASTGTAPDTRPGGEPGCGSFPAIVGDQHKIDLAPPGAFMETCSVDNRLCLQLESSNPSGMNTLGLFLTSGDWVRHRRRERLDLGTYLIAHVTSTAEAQFPALKKLVRDRAAPIPDRANVRASLAALGRVDLGVVDESADSISSAVVVEASRSPGPQIAINTAFLLRGYVLSLYVHHVFSDEEDIEVTKRLSADWLGCLRRGNAAVARQP